LGTAILAYRHSPDGKVMVHKHVGKERWVPVLSPLGVRARLRQADQGDTYGLRVIVEGMDGQPRPLDLNRGELARMGAQDFRQRLYQAGLRTEADGDAIAVALLKAADPAEEITVVSRPGWHHLEVPADPIFVTPGGEVIGSPPGGGIELSVERRLQPSLSTRGSIEGWRQAIEAASNVENCLHWVLGIVAGFAGPVLALAGLETTGLNLSGLSSSGKTLAQKLGASAWSSPGLGTGGLLRSMRVTENAIEAYCQEASGTVLALDELAHAEGKTIGRLIYSLASGVGKGRMRADATLRASYRWTTFALLSAERSVEDAVRRAGAQWQAGMAVRVPDVDVTGVNRAVDRATLDAIGGIEAHYGHAGPAFVRALVGDGLHRQADALRQRALRTAQTIAGEGADSARVRAATAFGVLLVAGEIAKGYAILPPSLDVTGAVKWAWKQFAGSSDAVALKPEDQAVASLRLWLAQRWDSSVRRVDATSGPKETLAWYDDDTVYVPTALIAEACGGALKEQEIGRILDETGLLSRRGSDKRRAVKYVPKVGAIQAYALRRAEVGRPEAIAPSNVVPFGGVR
jgi:hypothetical protein